MQIRRQIDVSGIVQGVGFRPYIYRLASERHLAGTIRNTSSGVTIEVEGPPAAVNDFVTRLPCEAPPLARITGIVARELPCNGDQEFRIIGSQTEARVRTLISPDVATCDDCLREMLDSRDRRYRYPFINCTNCGPRFTIIRDIPYDRPSTSMSAFTMCAACQAEYDDPSDRRFHAQPNACWDCGPKLEWWNSHGEELSSSDPIANAIAALQDGQIVAIKGLGGFHLAADATNTEAVELLRERKRRVGKPFAVMAPSLAAAEEFCDISEGEAEALKSIQRPIVLLSRRAGTASRKIADAVAPSNKYLGVFLPYTPLHHLLLAEGKFEALVMTSGNLSEEPIVIANDEALARLSSLADFFLMHNRDILLRCDDSVVRQVPRFLAESSRPEVFNRRDHRENREIAEKTETQDSWKLQQLPENSRTEVFDRRDHRENKESAEKTETQDSWKLQQLRRSRGFVPVPVFLKEEVASILAVGGELKNTICLTKGRHAFLSQHVGDLENLESYKFFEEAIDHLQNVLEIEPLIIAYDLHPDYFSTKWARRQAGLQTIGVQHHHAHIASCMAENHIDGKVIGFALDGTGYGTDGNIWGGEVFIADFVDFERAAHFEYVPMPGGSAAIREPWRMAVSYLLHHFGRDFLRMKLPFLGGISRHKLALLMHALERHINSPLTSSCGRLFDAVAAIAGVRQEVTYEAQAAIELEMALDLNCNGGEAKRAKERISAEAAYRFEVVPADGLSIISTRPMFEALLKDVGDDIPVAEISRKFHDGLVNVFVQIGEILREHKSLNRICLSGGTFNNLYLTVRISSELRAAGFEVFTQNEVPAGDGGLSLGQAMIAAHRSRT